MRRTQGELDLLLVNMPFGPLRQPSLGLSLLKASLTRRKARVLYLNLAFAERIGWATYTEIIGRSLPATALLGEWLFSAALDGSQSADGDGFLEQVAAAEAHSPLSEDFVRRLREVRAAAAEFLTECQMEVARLRPRIVGFTSVFHQHVASLALARRLKAADPELFILFGGPNCEAVMGVETLRRFAFVDAVVSGEADQIFAELVERVLGAGSPGDLPGVFTRDNVGRLDPDRLPSAPRARDLDALPYPDFDDFFAQWPAAGGDAGGPPRLLFETSRGCWWGEKQHCTFCGLNGTSMAFRSKSSHRALAELTSLAAKHPGCPVMVVDNILDMRYFRDFVPDLAAAGLDLGLFYEVKANLKKDQVRLLREAGIREIQPGIESFSDPVLALMRKGVTALQNIQLLKWCREIGVWPSWHFIWGFPHEPAEEYRRMADLLPFLTHLPPPGAACCIQLHRFSPNFEQAPALGFVDVEPCPAYRFVYHLPPEALANLAYYFEFRYQDGRDPGSYTGALEQRISEWQQAFKESELVCSDRGEELWIWDLRPAATRALTSLAGSARSIYLACDTIRTRGWLAEHGGGDSQGTLSDGEVEDVVGPLVEEGLMVSDGERLLSLATSARPKHGGEAEGWRLFAR